MKVSYLFIILTFFLIPTVSSAAIYFVDSNFGAATTITLDIGSQTGDRLVTVGICDEIATDINPAVTVDSKSCTQVVEGVNSSGGGSYQTLFYCDDDDLGSSSGTVNVTITSGCSGAECGIIAQSFTGVSQSGQNDYGTDFDGVNLTTTEASIDTPADGLVVMGACNGNTGTWGSWTSPLTEREDFNTITGGAPFAGASGVETSTQTNKQYQVTASTQYNRASSIVASWAKDPSAIDASFQEGVAGYSGSENLWTVSWSDNYQETSIIYLRDGRNNLFSWDISTIPSNAIISSARISLWLYESYNNATNYWGYLTDPDSRGPWVDMGSDGYTYNTGANYKFIDDTTDTRWSGSTGDLSTVLSSSLGSFNVTAGQSGYGEFQQDITGSALADLVQDWVDGTKPNNGIWIQDSSGNTRGRSKYYATTTKRPKLAVSYTIPTSASVGEPRVLRFGRLILLSGRLIIN
ncbi:MAG: DNRLRE domain-containing protein [bacterium]|nr:DNRLRE domain-containing protein [bacterium]